MMKLLMLCVPTPYPAQGLRMVQGPPPPEDARTPLGSWGFVRKPVPMMYGRRPHSIDDWGMCRVL